MSSDVERRLSRAAEQVDVEQRLTKARQAGAKKSQTTRDVRCRKRGGLRTKVVTVATTTTTSEVDGEKRAAVPTIDEVRLEEEMAGICGVDLTSLEELKQL